MSSTIPIEIQLKLVQIPLVSEVLDKIKNKLESLGRTRVPAPALPTREFKGTSKAAKELDQMNEDLAKTVKEKLSPAFNVQARDLFESQLTLRNYSRQTSNFLNLIRTQNEETIKVNKALRSGRTGIRELGETFKFTNQNAKMFNKSLEEGNFVVIKTKEGYQAITPLAANLADQFEKGRKVIGLSNAALIVTANRFGTVGLAVRRLSRDFFWLGLGTMFITMAFARLRRRQFQQERQLYSLRVAYRSVKRAQEAVTEAVVEFGHGSREAREAQERYRDAQERAIVAEESLRQSIEQTVYAGLMLFWGTIPTLIRGVWDLATNIQNLVASLVMDTAATESNTVAKIKNAAAQVLLKLGIDATNTSLLTTLVLTAALTLGLMALSYAVSQIMIAEQMKGMKKRMKELREEIGLTTEEIYPHSLVGAVNAASEALGTMGERAGSINLEGLRNQIESLPGKKEIEIIEIKRNIVQQEQIEIPEPEPIQQAVSVEVNPEDIENIKNTLSQFKQQITTLTRMIPLMVLSLAGPVGMGLGLLITSLDDLKTGVNETEKEMDDLNTSSKKLENTLVRESLIEALNKSRESFRELRNIELPELRTGEIGRLGPGINQRNLSIGSIQINAVVREEQDIRKIRNSLEDLFIKGYYSRGGL